MSVDDGAEAAELRRLLKETSAGELERAMKVRDLALEEAAMIAEQTVCAAVNSNWDAALRAVARRIRALKRVADV